MVAELEFQHKYTGSDLLALIACDNYYRLSFILRTKPMPLLFHFLDVVRYDIRRKNVLVSPIYKSYVTPAENFYFCTDLLLSVIK